MKQSKSIILYRQIKHSLLYKKKLLALFFTLIFATVAFAQSDLCATAVDLGTLPGNGGILCQNGTTVGATPTFPPFGINGCFGGNIPGNIPDVWYQFTASENTIEVNVNSLANVINNPAVTLWQDACITGTILDCGVGATNNVFMLFTGLIVGNTYWLLISGTGPDGFGDFEICIESNDINTCAQDQTVWVNPPPVSGVYLSDFLVEICISVDQPFVQNGADWFHGMVPSFGSGWNQATINPTQTAASCSGSGVWGWYASVTGTNTNPQNPGTVGPGFFYETSAGGPPMDGNPGNNFGDNCSGGTASWDFCFTIRTNDAAACIEGDDLTIQWVNYSDSETGSWGSNSICPGDPELAVQAVLTCCPPPDVVVNQLGCGGSTIASIEVTGVGIGPFAYTWSTGFMETLPLGTPSIISSLTPGIYWVFVEDLGDGCTTQRSFTIDPPSDLTVDAGVTQSVCSGDPVTMASTVTGGNPTYFYTWTSTPPGFTSSLPNPTFSPITANTTFHLDVTDLSSCSEQDDILVTIDACGTPIGATFTQINVLCFGESTGSIDVTPTGGVAPLVYAWGGGQTSQDLTNIPAGNYTLTISDGIGQMQIINVTITEPPQMLVSETVNSTTCGACDGSITLTPSGGTPGYEYSLDGGPFTGTSTYSNLCPAIYDVVVRDANLCEQAFNYDLTSIGLGVTTLTGSTINCFGELGQITATGTGGTVPYDYSLDGGAFQASGTFVGVAAGPHTVTTQDALGCQDVQNITLTEPTQLVLGTITVIDNMCFGDLLGEATINISGGTAPYEYSLDGGAFQMSNTFTNLAGGIYTLDIRDANGCVISGTPITIAEPTAMLVSETVNSTTCGACDGSITLTPSGGTPGYEYSLDGGPFTGTSTYSNLCPAIYDVVVRDANLCEQAFNYDLTSIGLGVTTLTGSTINCFGELGQITATGTGGTVPYDYSLDGGAFQASGTFVGVAAGPHTVTTQDALGCQDVQNITLTEPTQLVLGTITVIDNMCFGDLLGEATINISGGTAPYEYSLDGGAFQMSNTFTNLAGGIYTLDIRDANGCVISGTPITIAEPTAMLVSETVNSTTCGACDGSITLTPSGGTPGYEYSLDGGPFTGTSTYSNLCPAIYDVVVRDANLCEQAFNYDLTSIGLGVTTLTGSTINCFGELGQITATGTGGTVPYDYSLDGGAFQASGTFVGVAAGPHTVTTQDALGCQDVQNITLTEPTQLVLGTITVIDNMCFGDLLGEATINISGGTAPYEYSLDGGAFQMSNTFTNLAGGIYTLDIRDANGCVISGTPITIAEPTAMLVSETVNSTTCGACDGSITLTPSGGTPGYEYSLDGGPFTGTSTYSNLCPAIYDVVVRDANLCEQAFNYDLTSIGLGVTTLTGSTINCFGELGQITATGTGGTVPYDYSLDGGAFQASGTFVGVAAGPHTVTTQDALGCQDVQNITLTEPTQLVLGTITVIDNMCFGDLLGEATINISGGTAPYEYSLDGGAFQMSNTFTNLAGGIYTLDIRDANGCVISGTPITIAEPTAMLVSETVNSTTCGACDGSITLTPSGGTPGYEYSLDGGPFTGTSTYSNLCPAIYDVVVRDANLCEQAFNYDLTSIGLGVTTLTGSTINCFGELGQITATGTGGTVPYDYSLDGGAFQASGTFVGVAAGPHTVTTQDALGCQDVQNITLTEPTQLVLGTITVIDNMCFGDLLGEATINISGGTAPYEYSLDGGAFQMSNTFTNLAGGIYTLDIRDANGCVISGTPITIAEPTAMLVSETVNSTTCGACDGSITLTPSGGTPGYEYSLDGGPFTGTSTYSNLCPAIYDVVVRDANLCEQAFNYDLTSIGLGVTTLTGSTINCFGELGQITATGTGGTVPYDYSLDGGAFQASGTFVGVAAGPHTVTTQDALGCQDVQNITLTEPTQLVLGTITVIDNMCFGDLLGEATINISGGTAPYEYSLDGGAFQMSNTFTNLAGGIYTLDIRDANGCVISGTPITIAEPTAMLVSETVNSTTCGACDGSITLTPSGGTPGYEYSLDGGPFTGTSTYSNLCPAIYDVVVRDANLCEQAFNYDLTSTAISGSVAVNDINCFGELGEIIVTASGGEPPFSYALDGGAFQSSNIFTNVTSGPHDITIEDINGCQNVQFATLIEPSELFLNLVSTINAQCNGNSDGSIEVIGIGGTAPYEYSINGVNYQLSGSFNGLIAGTYTLYIKDDNDCINTIQQSVSEPTLLEVQQLETTDVLCFDENTGVIIVSGIGGIPPYQYSLDGSTFINQGEFTSLTAGQYDVTIRDQNQCIFVAEATIEQPEELHLVVQSTTDVQCYLGNSGSITVDGTHGTPPYTYSINNGAFATSNIFDGLAIGIYHIRIKDNNGCLDLQSITINQPTEFVQRNLIITDVNCNGQANGTIHLMMEGGVFPYEFRINNGDPQPTGLFRDLEAGNHTIQVIDNNGCEFERLVNVNEPEELREADVTIVNASCDGNSNGSITIHAQGGTAPYEYSLNLTNQFQSSNLFEDLQVGSHIIKIRDSNGCLYVYNFEITEPEPLPTLSFENLANSYCDNEEALIINYSPDEATISGSGVNGNTGVFDPSSLQPGIYEIKIVFTHPITNCAAEHIKMIEIFPTTEADFAGLDDFYCYNNPEVELIGIPEGGTFDGFGISNNTFGALHAEEAGIYEIDYTYTNEFGCIDKVTKEVEISGPKFQIEDEIDVNYGDSIILAPVLDFDWNVTGIEFLWEPATYLSCVNCTNPVVTPEKDVIYSVTAIDNNGCSQTQIIRINAVKDIRVFIPSAFSPNDDGINDILVFNSNNLVSKVNYFKVFNRWGNLMFEATDFEPNNDSHGWDGRFNGEELNGGAYVYYTEFVFIDGTVQTKSGWVTLLK